MEEGLDGETFFLYVFLLAFAVLLLLAGHHFLSSFGSKKTTTVKKPAVETGTNIKDGIDYDWIPKELLNDISKGEKTLKCLFGLIPFGSTLFGFDQYRHIRTKKQYSF